MAQQQQFPIFEKSARLEVTQQPDAASSAQAMINQFQDFSNTATTVAAQVTKQESDERKDVIKNNISTSYQQFAQDSLMQLDQQKGLQDYNIKAVSYGKEVLKQTDSYNKDYAKNLLDYYANSHRDPLVKNAILQNKRSMQVDSIERNAQSTDDTLDAIHNADHSLGENEFDSAMSLHTQHIKAMENDVKNGLMQPKTFSEAYKSLRKQFKTEVILKKYKDAQDEGRGSDFLHSLANTNIEGLDEHDRDGLMTQIKKINLQHLTEAGLTMDKFKDQIKDEYKGIENTGRLPNAELTNLVETVTPEKAEEFETQKRISMRLFHIKQAAAEMNPVQVNEYLDGLTPKPGSKGEYPQAVYQELHDRAVVAVDKQRKEIADDPMAFSQKQSIIQNTARNYQLAQNINAVGEHKNSSPVNDTVTPPWQDIIRHQQRIGLSTVGKGDFSVRLMTNADARTRVLQMEQSTPQQKLALMDKWKQEYGGGLPFKLAVKQLVNSGMPQQYALLAGIDPNSAEASDVVNAFSVPLAEQKKLLEAKDESTFKATNQLIAKNVFGSSGFGQSKEFQGYINSFSSYAGGKNEDFMQGNVSTLQSLSYHYLLTGKESSYTGAVNRAQKVLSNRYDYANVNNNTVRIPKEYESKAITNYANKQTDAVKKYPFALVSSGSKQVQDLDKQLIQKGHWVNDPNDEGLAWVDFNGRLRADKNNQPLTFTFEDAQYGHVSGNMKNLDALMLSQAKERQGKA